MIIDSSALIAILRNEHDARKYADAIASAFVRRLSAANYVETAAVIDSSRDPVASRRFDDFLREAEIVIETVTAEQAQIARHAYKDYGRGSGHPAKLNFGDCFSYALAKVKNEPLLFKGNDFTRTDIAPHRMK